MIRMAIELLRQFGPLTWLKVFWAALIRGLSNRLSQDTLAMGAAFQHTLRLGGAVSKASGGHVFTLPANSAESPTQVLLRKKTTDYQVFNQIFRYEEYRPLVETMRRHYPAPVRYIVDAGANIGCTTLYLKRFFPEATVIAIEPAEKNVAALRQNLLLNGYEDSVSVAPCGLWVREATLALRNDFRGGREWSFSLEEVPAGTPGALPAITLAQAVERAGFPQIDILKIDIEGAERYWFEQPGEAEKLLEGVQALAIEIHPESINPEIVLRHLDACGFFYAGYGETVFAYRKNWRFRE